MGKKNKSRELSEKLADTLIRFHDKLPELAELERKAESELCPICKHYIATAKVSVCIDCAIKASKFSETKGV